MKKRNIGLILIGLCLFFSGHSALALETLCAEVQIEVRQEATLVRQGFDAHMRINNGLPIDLKDVTVEVEITDADGNVVETTSVTTNTTAEFFIRVDHQEGITNGTVGASTSADLNWLIIPTVQTDVSNQWGEVFYVGAHLEYSIEDKTNEVTVVPDGILVKPLPELALDYFLPEEVYGMDPVTEEGEVVPFSLGVLVKNSGYGTAKSLKINSAQPEIVQNTNGLLVGFSINNSEVNGKVVPNSLLVDFGDVKPQEASLARWEMQCSLSGEFSDFSADITHADELGGEVTSLISTSQTHTLVHDVLMDLSGRDVIRDFLTTDMNVYESDGVETTVSDISSAVTLSGSGMTYTVSDIPANMSGPVYMKLLNSLPTQYGLTKVVRSDGRLLPEANRWLSLTRQAGDDPIPYLNLFDADGSGTDSYTVYYEVVTNQAPVLVVIGDQTAYAGTELAFGVHSYDLDDTIPGLSTGTLPEGAQFFDFTNGHGRFVWTPTTNQVGSLQVTFNATDDIEVISEDVTITVLASSIPVPAGPAWWQRGVLNTNAGVVVNDFAPVNQGQLKNIAMLARDEMEKLYGGTNGVGGAGFDLSFTNTNNYLPVNIGQVKYVRTKFYDRMGVTNYPWMGSTNPASDFAMVNIGQIKNLFDFDPLKDSDNDGMPDWWEDLYGGGETNMMPEVDLDGDGMSNRDEYFNNTVPVPTP